MYPNDYSVVILELERSKFRPWQAAANSQKHDVGIVAVRKASLNTFAHGLLVYA